MSKESEKLNYKAKNSSISNENAKYALTTIDNPYDPFIEFSDWFMFDNLKGYGTCSLLARIAKTSDSLSESENNWEINRAIDEILKYDFMKIYKKVENKNYKITNY